jgi:NAD(P)H-dependent flavin oxidoreductase YrpB (nitropropane dioxygenase family)
MYSLLMARRVPCVDTAAMLTTRFTKMVGCSVPIQQAGMGPVSPPQLSAAVSQAGGLGTVAARQAGVVDPPMLARLMEEVRASTSQPFWD